MFGRKSQEEKEYVESRGFTIKEGSPTIDVQYPYIQLLDPYTNINAICYVQSSPNSLFQSGEIIKPDGKWVPEGVKIKGRKAATTSELVQIIVGLVKRGMISEGRLYNTQPGQKFEVYIEDILWKDVVAILEKI